MAEIPRQQPVSLRAAQTFAAASAHMGASVRRSFVLRSDNGQSSPLEDLMRATRGGAGGGRGGRTRLALLLSLWWVNSKAPYTSDRPTSWWAELIGIADPIKGSRTVAANLNELARRQFLIITPGGRGKANIVTLLDDHGRTGMPYSRPDGRDSPFFRIPEQLWTTGMIGRLSGPGLVMYLMLLYYHRLPAAAESDLGPRTRVPSAPPIWFSPKSFAERHGLSEDTRLAGIQDLRAAGVIQVDSQLMDTAGPSGRSRFRRQFFTINPPFTPPLPGAAPSSTRRLLNP